MSGIRLHTIVFCFFVTIGWAQSATVPATVPETTTTATSTPPTTVYGAAVAPETPDALSATPVATLNAAAALPIGVPSYNVRMPEFDDVRLISRMRVAKLVRIDDDQLDLLDLHLERYLPSGGIDYIVTVERGFYDLHTGRLVSSTPTRLRSRDFDMHGEGCVYAKDVEIIKILGKVTSYIYLKPKPKAAAPADPPAAPPQPSPKP